MEKVHIYMKILIKIFFVYLFFLYRDEWDGIGKKNPLSYWDAEEYPKSWGFGNAQNPLPIDSVEREQLPMRDSTWFSTPTKVRQVHQPARFIPHSGLTTETRIYSSLGFI